ncbi:MAG TPA: hypothetical protein VEH82_00270 [Acidimicrobiales bacterium]|nr:hypothetical protein [Acidimicrobiales bacterium]
MRTRAALLVLASLGLGVLAVLPALPASAKQSPFNAKALKNSINRTKNLTYEAQYSSVSSGQTETVTVAQSPPKSAFVTSSGSVVNNGKATYYCGSGSGSSGNSGNSGNSGSGNSGSASSSKVSCVSTSMSNPLLGLEETFSPQVVINALRTTVSGIIARALGVKVAYSSATYAGQPSSCMTISRRGQSVKYCVTKQGILSYSGTGSAYLELSKFSTSPPASLFQLPAGATVSTLPTGLGSGSSSG